MNNYVTKGIVLGRTNFGEADRIITFLTPSHGKVRVMAKGVRKSKSKLAGGIELFSVTDLTLLIGKSEIQTLMSCRLDKHFGQIVKDAARTQAGYEAIKLISKATEDQPEEAYFNLLSRQFESLNDSTTNAQLAELWFGLQLLKLAGHTPDLHTDLNGNKLTESHSYDFQLEAMRFTPKDDGEGIYQANDIKFLRLGLQAASPGVLQKVQNAPALAANLQPLVLSMLKTFFRL